MITIKRRPKTQQCELEKHPDLCVIVCTQWEKDKMGLSSFLRGFGYIDRDRGGNKRLLDELNFLSEIARLRNG